MGYVKKKKVINTGMWYTDGYMFFKWRERPVIEIHYSDRKKYEIGGEIAEITITRGPKPYAFSIFVGWKWLFRSNLPTPVPFKLSEALDGATNIYGGHTGFTNVPLTAGKLYNKLRRCMEEYRANNTK